MSEHAEQCAAVAWFRLQYPQHRRRLIASGNGLHIAGTPMQRAIKWRKFEKAGGVKGTLDLFLAIPRGPHHGLFIEMKYGKNTTTDDQDSFADDMQELGYATTTCWSADEAIKAIQNYLKG